jgi:poly-gamma-glutamate capsule biosynthesis protein CapA/YwtB (metallophosphatase superfamily)
MHAMTPSSPGSSAPEPSPHPGGGWSHLSMIAFLWMALGFLPNPTSAQLAGFDSVASRDTTVPEGFTVVTVGDVILGRTITVRHDPELEAVLALLRSADVAFGNKEGTLLELSTFDGYPAAQYGGAYHVAPPEVAEDMRAMGFNLMALANNHTLDWGAEGMRETMRHLDRVGIVHAGSGENLGQARAPGYLEIPAGRIALVSTASSFTELSRAGHPTSTLPGRPGISALRLRRTAVVSSAELEMLRALRDQLPGVTARDEPDTGEPLSLLGQRFQAGDSSAFTYDPNESDVVEILRGVREGKQLSDFLLFTQHAHEPGNWSREPGDYLPEFARSTIREGADMFVGHGPHRLRGIEIYQGRPIFYSLGNFIFHDNLTPVPHAMYERDGFDPWRDTDGDVNAAMGARFHNDSNFISVVAVSRFRSNGEVAEIRLHPIELREEARLANRGAPRLAPGDVAQVILQELQTLSAPFGTSIAIEDGVGVIRIPPAPR